ncbi:hypothetical protein BBP40_001184 [Aspergillus hancockii]|nr:hypothetical protein BBP40_001184 [Aspergillus hancockii]
MKCPAPRKGLTIGKARVEEVPPCRNTEIRAIIGIQRDVGAPGGPNGYSPRSMSAYSPNPTCSKSAFVSLTPLIYGFPSSALFPIRTGTRAIDGLALVECRRLSRGVADHVTLPSGAGPNVRLAFSTSPLAYAQGPFGGTRERRLKDTVPDPGPGGGNQGIDTTSSGTFAEERHLGRIAALGGDAALDPI